MVRSICDVDAVVIDIEELVHTVVTDEGISNTGDGETKQCYSALIVQLLDRSTNDNESESEGDQICGRDARR